MSKLLVDVRTADLPTPATAPALPPPGPVGLIDRASLRLGLWLLLRSTIRANRRADRAVNLRTLETHRGLQACEVAAQRRLLLEQPHL
jgi:hypothetical protein